MNFRWALRIASEESGITREDILDHGQRDTETTNARQGFVVGLSELGWSNHKIQDETGFSRVTVQKLIARAQEYHVPVARIITARIASGDRMERPEGKIHYSRGSAVRVEQGGSLVSIARARGTVMSAAGATYVRDPQTGELFFKTKKVGEQFRDKGGIR